MGIVDALSMRIELDTGVPHLFHIANFAGVRVDVVERKVGNPGNVVRFAGGVVKVIEVPGNGLRAVSVVEVKVEDDGVREAVDFGSVGNANVDIVDPAKARGFSFGAVMSCRDQSCMMSLKNQDPPGGRIQTKDLLVGF